MVTQSQIGYEASNHGGFCHSRGKISALQNAEGITYMVMPSAFIRLFLLFTWV
jgi:hypothetical protein